jgi:hypothetical protein
MPVVYRNQCITQNVINDCDLYTPADDSGNIVCRRCKPGSYAKNSTTCERSSDLNNCDLGDDSGECIRCMPNSFLTRRLKDGKRICVLNMRYATSLCETFNYDTTSLVGDEILKRYSLTTTAEKAVGTTMLKINLLSGAVSINSNHFCSVCVS